MIKIKRVYEAPAATDGRRVLVDRLWPRGLSRQKAAIDEWAKDLAPSDALRRWFGHDPKRWATFRQRYRAELRPRQARLRALRRLAMRRRITLVYAAKDEHHNNAVVLKELAS